MGARVNLKGAQPGRAIGQRSVGSEAASPEIGNGEENGMLNADECLRGTNPALPDTDGDGVSDGVEAQMVLVLVLVGE